MDSYLLLVINILFINNLFITTAIKTSMHRKVLAATSTQQCRRIRVLRRQLQHHFNDIDSSLFP